MDKIQIVYRKTSDLIPYIRNPRKNDEAVPQVAASIKEFGFKVPIIVDSDGVIVAGHTRLKAAQMLGIEEVPTIVADDLNEQQIKAFRLVENKVSEAASWDFSMLDLELEELGEDLSEFGFKDVEAPDFDDFFADAEAKEKKEEEPEEIQCPHCKMWFKP